MNIQFRLPALTAENTAGQVRQLYGFLRQTVEQLNFALAQLEQQPVQTDAVPATAANTEKTQQSLEQFSLLKGLIIKSADIVNAYYTTIDNLLKTGGQYTAQSDFGTFKQVTEQTLSANTDHITQLLQDTQTIGQQQKLQRSYLQYGIVGTTLDEAAAQSAPGIEIGDFHSYTDGTDVQVQQRFARFTPYGLELFGTDKTRPIAYISGNRLYITDAHITGNLQLGGYLVSTNNGLAFNWMGG